MKPDVVYLDPMYRTQKTKEIRVSEKEMRVFQSLVGADLDADGLLEPALALATKRVVVKRPDYANWLNEQSQAWRLKPKEPFRRLRQSLDGITS